MSIIRKVFYIVITSLCYIFVSWYLKDVKGITIYNGYTISEVVTNPKMITAFIVIPICIIDTIIENIIVSVKAKRELETKKRK